MSSVTPSRLSRSPFLEGFEFAAEIGENLFEYLEIVLVAAFLGIRGVIVGADEIVDRDNNACEGEQGKILVSIGERFPEEIEEETDAMLQQLVLKEMGIEVVDLFSEGCDEQFPVLDFIKRELGEILDVGIGIFRSHGIILSEG